MGSQVNPVSREKTTILDTVNQDEDNEKSKKSNLWKAIIHEVKDAGELTIFKY
jgi:hypothetical protein